MASRLLLPKVISRMLSELLGIRMAAMRGERVLVRCVLHWLRVGLAPVCARHGC